MPSGSHLDQKPLRACLLNFRKMKKRAKVKATWKCDGSTINFQTNEQNVIS